MEERLTEIAKKRREEEGRVQIIDTMRTTRVITRVETYLMVILVLANLGALAVYMYTDIDLKIFIVYYLVIAAVVNASAIFLYQKWENRYVEKKAREMNVKLSLIRTEYNTLAKQVKEGLA